MDSFATDINGAVEDAKIISTSKPISSLYLQVAVHFDRHYLSWAFFYVVLLVNIYKTFRFGLSQQNLEVQIVLLAIL